MLGNGLVPYLFSDDSLKKPYFVPSLFSDTARYLIELNYFSPLLKFILGILLLDDRRCVDRMYHDLRAAERDTGVPVADIASRLFKKVYQEFLTGDPDAARILKLNLYKDRWQNLYRIREAKENALDLAIPQILYPIITGKEFYLDQLTERDIDGIVFAARDIQKANLLIDAKKRQKRLLTAQRKILPADEIQQSDIDKCVPGLLQPLLIAFNVSGSHHGKNLTIYLLENYFLPAAASVLTARCCRDHRVIAVLTGDTAKYIHSVLRTYGLHNTMPHIRPSRYAAIYQAAVGSEDPWDPMPSLPASVWKPAGSAVDLCCPLQSFSQPMAV